MYNELSAFCLYLTASIDASMINFKKMASGASASELSQLKAMIVRKLACFCRAVRLLQPQDKLVKASLNHLVYTARTFYNDVQAHQTVVSDF